jgi:uncharacterized protein with ParB-like and HNH nuclease domain
VHRLIFSSVETNFALSEVLSLLFDILSQEIDSKLIEQYRGIEVVLKKSLKLLRYIARGNDVVQLRLFERLDSLLEIKVVESDLAVALKEVCPN